MISKYQKPTCQQNNPTKQSLISNKNTKAKLSGYRKGRIRTHDTINLYKDLANLRYKPLSHFSK